MKRGTKRQRDGNKFSRLIKAGRVPKFRKPGTHSGVCAHVASGTCENCRNWRNRLMTGIPHHSARIV